MQGFSPFMPDITVIAFVLLLCAFAANLTVVDCRGCLRLFCVGTPGGKSGF